MNTTINNVQKYVTSKLELTHEFITKHAELVKRIAHHLISKLPASVQINDLIQSGMIGLLEAAKNYDNTKGASFETYAGIRIRGSMIDEIRRGDWAPRSVHKNSRRIAEIINNIENKTGRDARDYEVAKELNISLEEYHKMLQDSVGIHLLGFDDLGIQHDFVDPIAPNEPNGGPFDKLQKADFSKNLAHEIAKLPERERLVLALYYEEELNLREVGEVLGVSESRISQIHGQAMIRLQARIKKCNL